jgi:hypothetical protein
LLFSIFQNLFYFIIIIYQVRVELGIAVQMWQDKRAKIAKSVDDLGGQLRPAIRAGWPAYIWKTNPAEAVRKESSLWQGPLIGHG